MGKLQNRIAKGVLFMLLSVYLCVCLFFPPPTNDKCVSIYRMSSFCDLIRIVNSVITIATFVLLLNGVWMRLVNSRNILNN